ncbi:hypothetical protein EDB19DRAFT_2040598 [Suillus lakei]|nr:hypothetical protein EDB19DRAFT_2040598 [Suillus lakei]
MNGWRETNISVKWLAHPIPHVNRRRRRSVLCIRDIPEDLVTSPLLSPTPELGELRADCERGRFGAKLGGEGKQVETSHSDPCRQEPKLGSRSTPHTPPPEEPFAQPADVPGPEVQYKADVALHMVKYHSTQARDASSSRVAHSQSQPRLPSPSHPPLQRLLPLSAHTPHRFPQPHFLLFALFLNPQRISRLLSTHGNGAPMTTHFHLPTYCAWVKDLPWMNTRHSILTEAFMACSKSVPPELKRKSSPHTIRSSLPPQDEAYTPEDEH